MDLPHSWNRLGEYSLAPTGSGNNDRGFGWYRLALDGSRLPKQARHFLQFDGVGNIADVWVNGIHVGRHAGAFSRFRFDITGALRFGGPNAIVVRADNSKPAPGSTTEHVIPLLGDFFIHGGIYRGVSLISSADQHIDLLDYGSSGIYVRTESLSRDWADLSIVTRVRNSAQTQRTLAVRVEIRDSDGDLRGTARSQVQVPAGSVTPAMQAIRLPQPRLWDGRRDPHLYRAIVELSDGGRLLDRVVQPFGVRRFHVDPDRGFFLNGAHLPLHGVSRHQDWLDKGWALGRSDHERDMALIAEMGANAVRFAHYQHARDWFDLADRSGMIVWAELPFVNKVSFGDATASRELIANARQQMIELIRQNFNHPSVVTWGIGNEVDIDLAFGRLGPNADALPLLEELHRLSKTEDPDRLTVIADCCEDTPSEKIPDLPVLSRVSDLMGYNRYFGWYYGKVGDLGPHLDALHAKHPEVPISVSEYGGGGATSQHSDNPEGGPIDTSGRPHPEQFQSWLHEQSWPQLERRPYLWANWIWNMFDFSSDIRKEGDATDINDKGLVTFDRRVKKDAFFYYRAQWSDELVVHITGRRYINRAYPVNDIRIYSNAPFVSATLNGRSLGNADCRNGICVFPQVAMPAGAVLIEARGRSAAGNASDQVRWDIPAAQAGIALNAGDLAGFVRGDGKRVGSDNWFAGGRGHRIGGAQASRLSGAGDARFHTGYREGEFAYSIPLPNGRWTVQLLSLEPDEKRKTRRFDLAAEGRTVLSDFDPGKSAGGPLKVVERSFVVDVADGVLDLNFTGDAILSGIDVSPAGRLRSGARPGTGRMIEPA